jgi:hypothetical protein
MRVNIDESRSHHPALRVNGSLRWSKIMPYGRDSTLKNGNVRLHG